MTGVAPARPRLVLALVGGVALGGCLAGAPGPEAKPRGHSPAEVARDEALCRSGPPRRFAACMVARRYRVTLPVDAGGERGRVDVWAPEARAEAAVVDDLAACQAAGDSVLEFAACLIGRRYVAVPLGHHRH